jgi:hypothetical protein
MDWLVGIDSLCESVRETFSRYCGFTPPEWSHAAEVATSHQNDLKPPGWTPAKEVFSSYPSN